MVVVVGNVSHVLRSRHFSFLLTITRASQFFRCKTRFFVYRIFDQNNFKDESPVIVHCSELCAICSLFDVPLWEKNIPRAIFRDELLRNVREMFAVLRELRSFPGAWEKFFCRRNHRFSQLLALYAAPPQWFRRICVTDSSTRISPSSQRGNTCTVRLDRNSAPERIM